MLNSGYPSEETGLRKRHIASCIKYHGETKPDEGSELTIGFRHVEIVHRRFVRMEAKPAENGLTTG